MRLTAADGYTATRSYSASAPGAGDHVELTVQRVPDGEVSPFLADGLAVGDAVELRGPVGGWFVWRAGAARARAARRRWLGRRAAHGDAPGPRRTDAPARPSGSSTRCASPTTSSTATSSRRAPPTAGVGVRLVHTRRAPDGDARPVGRLRRTTSSRRGWTAEDAPTCYVCGPTGFVEAAADLLVGLGHAPDRVRTERFGPSGP